MKLSRVSISVKLNTVQPKTRDDIWWDALKVFLPKISC